MKLRSAPLDDVYNELEFVLHDDGGRIAKFVLWCFRLVYGLHRAAMLATLRRGWKKARNRFEYPPIGYEPFNLDPSEMENLQ